MSQALPFTITADLAQFLIACQFPQWLHLPLDPVVSAGTANTLFRLGTDKVLRFPRSEGAIQALIKEHTWLPQLSPYLPLTVPQPLEQGLYQNEYPWPWAIYTWIEGQDLWVQPPDDLEQTSKGLAQFILALQKQAPQNGPLPGEHNSYRGVPLIERDPLVRKAILELGDRVDKPAVTRAWEAALEPIWNQQAVWIHGDLIPGNLLGSQGKLIAVIDFGLLGVGDPAVELLPAWNLFDAQSRPHFQASLACDQDTWIRGKGWALYQALLALPYYWETNPQMVSMAQRMIHEILAKNAKAP